MPSLHTWSKPLIEKLNSSLIERFDKRRPINIAKASQYPLSNGGKRIRPLFVFSAAASIKGEQIPDLVFESALCAAQAIELIHTYSLVHDDLPCMDDDDYRRGVPTVHKAYGEAPAVLIGDLLLTEAFYVLSELSPELLSKILPLFCQSAGIDGMIGGQSLDVGFEGPISTLEDLKKLHAGKTGALILCSVMMGGLCSGATREELKLLEEYGRCIGLAFQMADDVLDADEDAEEGGPPSYVKLIGIEQTQNMASQLCQKAIDAAEQLPNATFLKELALFTIHRNH